MPDLPHAEFCISHPFSGFQFIVTYCGNPKLIQYPPCPYQQLILSSTHIKSEGEKWLDLYELKRKTKSSINRHRYFSEVMSMGFSFGCFENRRHFQIWSNQFLDIRVWPNLYAGSYFDVEVVDQRSCLFRNSTRVAKMHTPKSFNYSPCDIGFKGGFWENISLFMSITIW